MLASSVALGAIAGIATRGNWRNLRAVHVHWLPLAMLALGVRVVGVLIALPLPAYVGAIVLVALIAARNVHIPGALLIALGSLLNAVVIVANGGMPVDASAAAIAGASPLLNDPLHTTLGPETRLPWLVDIVPFAIFRNVYSAGDFLIAAGGFWAPFALLRRK